MTDLEPEVLVDGTEAKFLALKSIINRASSLLWVTTRGMLRGSNPRAAVATGLIRMLITEDPTSRYGIFHLELGTDASNPSLAASVARREMLISGGDLDREVAVYNGIEYISRLLPDESLSEHYRNLHCLPSNADQVHLTATDTPIEADFANPGQLSSLHSRQKFPLDDLLDSWIEVRTEAVGLSWKDVAVSATKVDMDYFSSEVAVIVTKSGSGAQAIRPGDRVFGLA